jgi:hypothetical protein
MCGQYCEQYFDEEIIKQALPLPTMRHQHYRLVSIDGIVHEFDPRKKIKRKLKFIQE